MASPNRTSLLTKAHKVLKKHYKPVAPVERPVLEQLLYAACLENAHYEPAQQAYDALAKGFFDWNEVRVSTARELAEVMPMLPDPSAAATNVKKMLYGVFESSYSFDLEGLKKQNLGQAIQRLKKLNGATPFIVAFATQTSLAGHAVPIDRGALDALKVIGAADEGDKLNDGIPGMERAIAKSKGQEFGSLLHQLGADLVANPYSPNLHKILLEIAPDAKDRLPKRPPKNVKPPEPAPAAKPAPSAKPAPAKEHGKDSKEHGKEHAKDAKPRAAEPVDAKAAKKKADEAKAEPAKRAPAAASPKKPEPAEKKPAPAKKKPVASAPKRKPR
jgi:hypothetical protein